MKSLDLKSLLIMALVGLALALVASPTKYFQEPYPADRYAMLEPFSSEPLYTY